MKGPERMGEKGLAATEERAIARRTPEVDFFWGELAYTERSLAIACTRGREAVVSRFRSLLAAYGLTEQQWRVLRVLYDYAPISLTELCALCCIHKVSMTRILRALMERGLVERARHGGDRRAYVVSLTAEGSKLLDETTPVANDIYAGIARQFGLAKTRRLLTLLRELAEINAAGPSKAGNRPAPAPEGSGD